MNSYPMGSSFLYQENPAAAESPPLRRGGTIANGDQGGEENFPGQLRGQPPLDRGGLCALRVEIRETWGGRPPVIYGIRVY